MSDSAVENAIAIRDGMAEKIAEAEGQVKEWRAKMERAERFIADWREFSGEAPEQSAQTAGVITARVRSRSPQPHAKPVNPKKEEVAEVARKILLAKGAPMSRDDLFAALTEKGVIIHGKEPPVVLQTMLWRISDRIIHLKGFGYWSKDQAYEPAAYDPVAFDAHAKDIERLI